MAETMDAVFTVRAACPGLSIFPLSKWTLIGIGVVIALIAVRGMLK